MCVCVCVCVCVCGKGAKISTILPVAGIKTIVYGLNKALIIVGSLYPLLFYS